MYALVFSGVLLALSAGVLIGVRLYLMQQSYDAVRASADGTVSRMLDVGEELDIHDNSFLDEARVNTELNISVASPSGEIVNQSSNFYIPDNDATVKPGVTRRFHTGGLHIMVRNVRVAHGNDTVAWLQVAKNLESLDNFIGVLFSQLAFADSLGIILSVIIGSVVSRRMLSPIDRMTKAAKRIGIKDLTTRIPVSATDDELSRLAITFNEMLDRLRDSVERQSRFVADASHELRTPISVMLGYAGLLGRWGKDDPQVLEESVEAIKHEALSMRELTERLLFLARSDAGFLAVNATCFNAAELLEEIAAEYALVSPDIAFTVEAKPDITLTADRGMLKQMLRDLADNSVKFTKKGGAITLKAAAGKGFVTLSVCDNGIGIPPEEKENIFGRFVRVDRARARATGGSGLGLSIVKSIADAHGASIDVESEPGKGTCVSVRFPKM